MFRPGPGGQLEPIQAAPWVAFDTTPPGPMFRAPLRCGRILRRSQKWLRWNHNVESLPKSYQLSLASSSSWGTVVVLWKSSQGGVWYLMQPTGSGLSWIEPVAGHERIDKIPKLQHCPLAYSAIFAKKYHRRSVKRLLSLPMERTSPLTQVDVY